MPLFLALDDEETIEVEGVTFEEDKKKRDDISFGFLDALFEASPEAVNAVDGKTGLNPFALAASNDADLDTILFALLSRNPATLANQQNVIADTQHATGTTGGKEVVDAKPHAKASH